MKKTVFLFMGAIAGFAAQTITLPNIAITGEAPANVIKFPDATNVTADSASLLKDVPGVSINSNGGIASLPAIHGLSDERVKIDVDGMTITSACPNHMNPALSYINTMELSTMKVIAGITPVSEGGDSIGGTIVVRSKAPRFATQPDNYLFYGDMTFFEHSNGAHFGAGINANAATRHLNIGYSGFVEKAGDYRDGNGNIVKDTLFQQRKQTLSLAYKINDENVIEAKVSKADTADEGFPNQYMDMLSNNSTNTNIRYIGKLGILGLDATVFQTNTNHYMNKILTERSGNMPMNTSAKEIGYNLKATLPITDVHTLKFGSDADYYTLNDWWPPVGGMMMKGMNPNTFVNINNGHRDRIGFYLEDVAKWTKKLSTNIGVRSDIVTMKTGDVVGYNDGTGAYSGMASNDPTDAAAFNALNHSKRDVNFGVTVMTKYVYSDTGSIAVGYARKTRSPDIYERYAWAGGYGAPIHGAVAMDMRMINVYGDGNGYVGNLNLKPEVANTFSATWSLHDAMQRSWGLKITPYYTGVQNYIDAQYLATFKGVNYLQFVNRDAILYGADLSGYIVGWNNNKYGRGTFKTVMGYTRGMRKDGGSLYHMMPFHAKVSLDNIKGAFNSGIDVEMVAAKDSVDSLRNEPKTPEYTLVDLRAGYQFTKKIRFDVAVRNLLDRAYEMPLGGVDLVSHSGSSYTPMPGMGRSVDMAMNIKF